MPTISSNLQSRLQTANCRLPAFAGDCQNFSYHMCQYMPENGCIWQKLPALTGDRRHLPQYFVICWSRVEINRSYSLCQYLLENGCLCQRMLLVARKSCTTSPNIISSWTYRYLSNRDVWILMINACTKKVYLEIYEEECVPKSLESSVHKYSKEHKYTLPILCHWP